MNLKTRVLALVIATVVVSHAQQPAPTADQRFYSALAVAANGTNLGKTATVGAPTGDDFTDSRQEGAILVGLDIWKGNFADHLVIRGVCPIYQTEAGKVRGSKHGNCSGNPLTIEAKAGFAVAGIETKGGLRVDGFQMVFMRIDVMRSALGGPGTYKSEWVGGKGGDKERRLLPNQKPVIGIYGAAGAELDRIGLLFYDRK